MSKNSKKPISLEEYIPGPDKDLAQPMPKINSLLLPITHGKVLVVEDDSSTLRKIQEILKPFPESFLPAISGQQAIPMLMRGDIALILLNVRLSDMDGFDLAATIRQNTITHEIPMIFMSASAGDERQETKAYDAGAVDYLVKPITPRILRGKVHVFIDLYENRLRNERQNRELQRSNNDLKQFAYVVSHDLKSPLRGLALAARWLQKDLGSTATADIHENIQLMLERTLRMDCLIDGILKYSQVGSHAEVLTSVDIHTLIQSIVTELQPPDSISVRIEGTLPTLTGDEVQFRQVFQNLLSNAVQHFGKPVGEIIVSSRENTCSWTLTVRDTGMGFPQDQHHKIFELFHTIGPKKIGAGTGLGLAIVKKIVEKQGGMITVSSKEGEGASFAISYPKTLVCQYPETILS